MFKLLNKQQGLDFTVYNWVLKVNPINLDTWAKSRVKRTFYRKGFSFGHFIDILYACICLYLLGEPDA